MIESFKIVLICMVAAILYGTVHDQITVRVCLEYFSVFHPPVFATQSPTLLAFGWGAIATWWVGALLGVGLAIAARVGTKPKLSAVSVCRSVGRLLIVMAGFALLAGLLGFILAQRGFVAPQWISTKLPQAKHARFMADLWAHSASYGVGLLGGASLCVQQYRKRGAAREAPVR